MDLVRSDFLPNPYFRKKIQKKNKKCNNLIRNFRVHQFRKIQQWSLGTLPAEMFGGTDFWL